MKIFKLFFASEKICSIFASAKARELSSVGLERLPYKQRVGGSNPSAPTLRSTLVAIWAFSSAGSEHLSDRQGVGGSNPSTPTHRGDSDLPGCDGRLAQLVQSVCLTSRGSGVRLPQLPPKKGLFQNECFDATPLSYVISPLSRPYFLKSRASMKRRTTSGRPVCLPVSSLSLQVSL